MISSAVLAARDLRFRVRIRLPLLALLCVLPAFAAFGQGASLGAQVKRVSGSGLAAGGKGIVFLAATGEGVVQQTMAKSVNFGSQSVSAGLKAVTLHLSIAAGTTVGSVAVLTTGAPHLDFADAGGSTCTAGTYSKALNCVVNVLFEPLAPGLRVGGVVFYDGSGNVLANVPLYGIGIAPETTFLPTTQIVVASAVSGGLLYPVGITADASGSVYIADEGNGRVVKETPSASGYAQSIVASGLIGPQGVAVDGSGNVYITDTGNSLVLKETPAPGGFSESTVGNGWNYPAGIAVDGIGNVYIADYFRTYVVMEMPSASGYTARLIGSGLSDPTAVAVDGSGNLYVADWGNDRVVKETLSAGAYTQTTVDSDLRQPNGVAVDGGGNVYITDSDNNRELKDTWLAGAYTQSVLVDASSGGLNFPTGVALDGGGNVYIADEVNNRVLKENLAVPPTLSFATVAGGKTSATAPKTVEISNVGNAELAFSAVRYPMDFPESASGGSTDCASTSTLAPGGTCTLTISFSPSSVDGVDTSLLLREDVWVTTDTLNSARSPQGIPVKGTETKLASKLLLVLSSSTCRDCSTVTLTATASGAGPTPSGTAWLLADGQMIGGHVALSGGVATIRVELRHSQVVKAVYSGSAAYAGSVSNSVLIEGIK
jgi:streptogramin lyase